MSNDMNVLQMRPVMALSFDLQDFILRARVVKLYRQALRIASRAPSHAEGVLYAKLSFCFCSVVKNREVAAQALLLSRGVEEPGGRVTYTIVLDGLCRVRIQKLSARDLFTKFDKNIKSMASLPVWKVLRKKHLQFGQLHNGAFLPRDAEDGWTQLWYTFSQTLRLGNSSETPNTMMALLGIELPSRVFCQESNGRERILPSICQWESDCVAVNFHSTIVLRHLRELFLIDPVNYMMAIFEIDIFREFPSPWTLELKFINCRIGLHAFVPYVGYHIAQFTIKAMQCGRSNLKIVPYDTIQLKQDPSWLVEDCFEFGPPLFNSLRGTTGFATTTTVREGHLQILEILLKTGASQPACEEALLEASYHGHAGFVELLLGKTAELQGGFIVRSTGRKDQHRKVYTSRGPRDRRVHSSANAAI
ncbi:hypothetical protein Nepgr_017721 [Nepenthes gracilis]|uniref:TCP domain-containing protein n=1 Tax=Nepenthes gracilis TaxID=150966 RepID=A0AAD3SRZ3_NEPGR|nr:hypothetical protein Nepgr_017721 [Nepenthes gracilis]